MRRQTSSTSASSAPDAGIPDALEWGEARRIHQSMTRFARNTKAVGSVMPSSVAALRLTTSS